MTTVTTKEQALNVLKNLTAMHGTEPYFMKADVVYSDGFFGVDMTVEGEKWRGRENRIHVPPQINRVPICVIVYG
jgi:hypothetical protein